MSFLLFSGHCLENAALPGVVQLCSYNSAASFYPLNVVIIFFTFFDLTNHLL